MFPFPSIFLSHLKIRSTRAFQRKWVCASVYRGAFTGLSWPGLQGELLHRALPLRQAAKHLSGQSSEVGREKGSVLPARTSEENRQVKMGTWAACKPPHLYFLPWLLQQMLSTNSKPFSVLRPLSPDALAFRASCPSPTSRFCFTSDKRQSHVLGFWKISDKQAQAGMLFLSG